MAANTVVAPLRRRAGVVAAFVVAAVLAASALAKIVAGIPEAAPWPRWLYHVAASVEIVLACAIFCAPWRVVGLRVAVAFLAVCAAMAWSTERPCGCHGRALLLRWDEQLLLIGTLGVLTLVALYSAIPIEPRREDVPVQASQ